MEWRAEEKYLVTDAQLALLRAELSQVMGQDEHSKDGSYLIRSLYFDDMADTCLRENEAGVNNRSKFRIRTYNNDLSFIRLEEKRTKNGYKHKDSAALTQLELAHYMLMAEGPYLGTISDEDDFVKKKLYAQILTRRMHPVAVVEYEREAFVEASGNVRITFDRNIGGSSDVRDFVKTYAAVKPVLPAGQHILEVKYDEFLPDHIKKIIDGGHYLRTAFSKYCYVRNM